MYTSMYTWWMDSAERNALARIRKRVEDGDVQFTAHFLERLEQRGLFLNDAYAAIEEATGIRGDGCDAAGDERWLVTGPTDLGDVEMVIVVDRLAKFVTIYWI